MQRSDECDVHCSCFVHFDLCPFIYSNKYSYFTFSLSLLFSSTISDPNTGSIVEIEAGKSGIRNLLQLRHGADNKVSE